MYNNVFMKTLQLLLYGGICILRTSASPLSPPTLQQRCAHKGSQYCHGDDEPSTGLDYDTDGIHRNGIYLGMYPNPKETLIELEDFVNGEFAFHGVHVVLKAGEIWAGKEVSRNLDDLRQTKAVPVISIIPDSTWWGFTKDNDCQVRAIAKQVAAVRKKLDGPIWLNFAPAMNCMSPPPRGSRTTTVPFELPLTTTVAFEPVVTLAPFDEPSYITSASAITVTASPTVAVPVTVPPKKRAIIDIKSDSDSGSRPEEQRRGSVAPVLEQRSRDKSLEVAFLYAWSETYAAVKKEAPDTKMIWSPSPTDDDYENDYLHFWPANSMPDIVGTTYEPSHDFGPDQFSQVAQPVHDDYAVRNKKPFLITQTAPRIGGVSPEDRIDFLNVITSKVVTRNMKYYFGAIYYNFKDEYQDKRIVILPAEGGRNKKETEMNKRMKAWVEKAAK